MVNIGEVLNNLFNNWRSRVLKLNNGLSQSILRCHFVIFKRTMVCVIFLWSNIFFYVKRSLKAFNLLMIRWQNGLDQINVDITIVFVCHISIDCFKRMPTNPKVQSSLLQMGKKSGWKVCIWRYLCKRLPKTFAQR